MSDDSTYPAFDRPERIATIWVDAWNRRHPDRLAALFDEDAEFVNVTGLWWHDRDAIRKAHAYGLRTIFNQSRLTLLRSTVKWIVGGPDAGTDDGPAVAVVHAKMQLTGQTPVDDVETPGVRRTLFSFVVHRTDAGWSCATAHNTDIVFGAETNVTDENGRLRPVDYRSEEDSA